MKRIHAFEFNDLSWFPKSFRNYGTDFLQVVSNTFDIYKCVLPVLEKGVHSSGNNTIVDLASGGGGGLIKIAEHLKESIPHLKIILSDYYPNMDAFKRTRAKQPDVFEYVEDSVNAMNVPPHLKGFRTQFLSFHHFRPKDAEAILQNAIDNNQPIGIFEAQQRDFKNLVQRFLSPISVLLLTPFIKPFRLDRIIFTYLIPLLPLFTLWDGLVSVLRTYTVTELKQMISALRNNTHFDWEVGIVKGHANDILYLLGTPGR
ncbi:MAG: class I SAM-dependent methyltransferase [Bacteroidota bacterium]|nr:class I SAM-dependent methyltransferase [Flavisolibacter sp.]MBD0295202.1 class I SAM-dependent methyltransferase [Flavisolibacter sp.]MBD0351442.1 class I SAM-dependent methyltransferase [Flavisolibacter sp.]MDQ3844096.1 class I SAM-dependent methyltransferase [Bacteroidota bacterium]